MKRKKSNQKLVPAVTLVLACSLDMTYAATLFKAANDDAISLVSSWWDSETGTTNPGAITTVDTLWFGGSGQAADRTVALGGDLEVGAIRLDNITGTPNYDVTISAGDTLTLNGNNDYTGGVAQGIVQNSGTGGSLTINSNIALGATQRWVSSRDLTVNGNVDLGANDLTLWSAGGTTLVSGVISGTGGILRDHSAGGAVRLTGVNTFTGNTTVNTGTLEIGGAGSLGLGSYAGDISIANNAIFYMNSSANQTLSGVISGDGSLRKNNTGRLVVTGSNTYTGGTTIDAGTIEVGAQTTTSAKALGTGVITMLTGSNLEIVGNISNWRLDNDFQGVGTITKIGGNRLWAGGDKSAAELHWVMDGSAADIGFGASFGGAGSSITVTAGSNGGMFFNPSIVLAADTSLHVDTGGTLNFNGSSSQSYTIASSISGAGTFRKETHSQTYLTGDNSGFSGIWYVDGPLIVGDGGTTGDLGTSNRVRFENNGGNSLVFNRSDDYTFGGVIDNSSDGDGSVEQRGSGKTTLTAANTYNGGTFVNAGKLELGHARAAVNGGDITIRAGELDIAFTSASGAWGSNVPNFSANFGSLTMGGISGETSTLSATGIVTNNNKVAAFVVENITYDATNNGDTATISAMWSGIKANDNEVVDTILNVGDSSFTNVELDFTGQISSNSDDGERATLVKMGAGTVRLSSVNYLPRLRLEEGEIIVNHVQALGRNRNISNLVTVNGGILNLNGFSNSIGGLDGTGGVITNNHATIASVLTIGDADGNSTYSGSIQDGVSAGIGITKEGTGTLTLSGVNTYTGNTVVENGTLALAASNTIASSALIDVQSGATLDVTAAGITLNSGQTLKGTGTIDGDILVGSGAFLAPGASPGTMSFTGDLTLDSGSTTTIEITGADPTFDFDVLWGTGATDELALGGTLVLDTTGYTATLGDEFEIFKDWTAVTGGFVTIIGADLGGGLVFDTSSLTVDGTLYVTAAIPEPSSTALIGLGGLALALRRRRS